MTTCGQPCAAPIDNGAVEQGLWLGGRRSGCRGMYAARMPREGRGSRGCWRAVRLAGAADRVRGVLGAAAHPAERRQLETWLSAAHQALGGAAFSAAWTAVQALGLAEAVQASAAAESNGPLRPAAPEPSARS